RKPEEARHRLDDAGQTMYTRLFVTDPGNQVCGCVRAFSKADQRLSEMPVGVHGDMARDVMENIRLGKVVQLVGAPDGDGGGELAIAKAVKEKEGGNVSTHRLRLEPGQRL